MFGLASSRRRNSLIVSCAASAVALVWAGHASAQTQLLLDPSFEPGIAGAPDASTGDAYTGTTPWNSWCNWAYDPVKNPLAQGFYTQSVPAHSGVQLAKTYGGPNGGVYQSVNINSYDAYTATAWFLNASGDAMQPGETDDVRITFFSGPNGTGTNLGLVISPLTVSPATPADTWTQLKVEAAAPAGTQSVQFMGFFNNPAFAGGGFYMDDASLLDTSWNGGGAGANWSDNNNWGGVTPGQYAPLVFAGTTRLNNVNDTTAGTPYYGIAFTPTAGSFVLTGNQVNLASSVNNYSANPQTIALPLGLQQDTAFNAQAGNITVSGAIGGSFALNKTGAGTLVLSGANTYGGATNVNQGTLVAGAANTLPSTTTLNLNGGNAQLAPGSGGQTIAGLSITGANTLDITNNHLIINYGGGTDPISTIASLLATGYNGGAWNGAGGIISSTAAANSSQYGVGFADSADAGNPAGLASGTLEIEYTLLGDADLNHIVNGIDFGIVAANFNQGVTSWDQGDFDYSHIVNGIDFGDLAANFNQGASGAAEWAAVVQFAEANGLMADVPEPATIGLLLVGSTALLARRKRRSI